MKIIILTIILIFLYFPLLEAQELLEEQTYDYKTPGGFDFITNMPNDYVQLFDMSTDPDNLWIWGIIAGSTAILLHYDEELVEWAQDLGNRLGIEGRGEETSKVVVSVGPYSVLKVPSDTGSSLYFIGDGSIHVGIMLGFLGYGYFGDDTKALSVGSQLAEGLFDVMIATQVLKHITGRQTPNTATEPGGKWDWFPNQEDYANHVPGYDAFPSGHLATAMMTTTVLHENYPDNAWILPISYTLMGMLSFQMLNNGVHWASDYPLAIGIGYAFGRIVSKRERDKANKENWSVVPKIYDNSYGFALNYVY